MKRVLRHFVIDTYSLWITSRLAEGIIFEGGIKTLFIAGIGVTIVSLLAKPVINLLLLPINLITFGLFRWVAAALVLFIVTLRVRNFKIVEFAYHGLSSKWLDIPALHFQGILAFIAFSFIFSLITSFIYWLIKS